MVTDHFNGGDGRRERGVLLLEEVVRIVVGARDRGETLRTGYHAGSLFAAYPNTFSLGRIVDELLLAATREKVAVEIGRLAGG